MWEECCLDERVLYSALSCFVFVCYLWAEGVVYSGHDVRVLAVFCG